MASIPVTPARALLDARGHSPLEVDVPPDNSAQAHAGEEHRRHGKGVRKAAAALRRMIHDSGNLQAQIFAALDDLAAETETEVWLAGLREEAIAPLQAYLARAPGPVPQARCFAVAMLARLADARATAALHDVLHLHPLAELPSEVAQAEYVVKNAVLTALAARQYPQRTDDIGFALRQERLPTAAVAAGWLQLTSLAPVLATFLDDDILAVPAMGALQRLQGAGTDALLAALQVRLETDVIEARERLALIRILLTLGKLRYRLPARELRRALRARHPAVRAAAAWLAWRLQPRPGLRRALLHGALAPVTELADACRAALESTGWPAYAALACLRGPGEPDIYGDCMSLIPRHDAWLIERNLATATDFDAVLGLIEAQAGGLLRRVLAQGWISDPEILRRVFEYGDAELRAAVTGAWRYLGTAAALEALLAATADPDRRVRVAARQVLGRWPQVRTALGRLVSRLPDRWSLLPSVLRLLLRLPLGM